MVDTDGGVGTAAEAAADTPAVPDEVVECVLIACENEAVFHTDEVTVAAGCWEVEGDLRGVQSSSGSTDCGDW